MQYLPTGLRLIRASKTVSGPVVILSSKMNGTEESARNGTNEMGTTLKQTTSKKSWMPKPQPEAVSFRPIQGEIKLQSVQYVWPTP